MRDQQIEVSRRRRLIRPPSRHGHRQRVRILALMLLGIWTVLVRAQENDASAFGRRVRIRLPITGAVDTSVKQVLRQMVAETPRNAERRPTIVLEFWADAGTTGAGSEFERSLSLARFLTSGIMEPVRTVAFIPTAVTGHAVLPVLACEQIVMAEDAILGEAGKGEPAIGPTMRGGYAEISRSRRTIDEAIALGMLDPELEVSRVTTDSGVLYAWPDKLEEIQAERRDLRAIDPVIPAGSYGLFRGDELREMGFVSHLASTHEELAQRLNLAPEQLEFDPSMGDDWRAMRIELKGPVTAQSVDRIIRDVQKQQDLHQANFLCLQIDSPGGDFAESMRLANFITDLDPSAMRTVAHVAREARGDAMLIAMACDHLVAAPTATLGGGGAVDFSNYESETILPPIQALSKLKGRDWSLLAACMVPEIEVFRYTRNEGEQTRYLCDEEYRQVVEEFGEAELEGWTKGEAVALAGETLQLDGQQAESLGLVRYLVESLAQIEQLYSLTETPALIAPNWAFDLIDALASPQLASLLLFIGGFALLAELSSPGIGIGGFIAAVCYTLFFWSNFLHGTAEVLEILMFLLGIAFILVEVFVIPGFGIFGIGGAAMVLASLVLASQTFVVPRNEYQFEAFRQTMMMLTFAGIALIGSGFALRKYLGQIPLLNHIILAPPEGDEKEELVRRESLVDFEFLLGQRGVAQTQLTPSGKAMLDGVPYDVISEGELIEKGSPIEVLEIHGNRVIVRAVS